MAMDEHEAALEEFIDEVSRDAVESYKDERLVSYFLENPRLVERPLWAIEEAEAMLAGHPSAAHVFATAAVEVAIKTAVLKPLIHGFVHNEAVAGLLADLLLKQSGGVERFKEILFPVLATHGGIDLASYQRPGSPATLWNEISQMQRERNAVVHRAEEVAGDRAEAAIAVANHVLRSIFRQLISRLGLHLLASFEVCTQYDPRAARERREGGDS